MNKMPTFEHETEREAMERLWAYGRRAGLSRRRFVELLGLGGVGAVLAACEAPAPEAAAPEATPVPWVKDPGPFIRHATNLETRLEDLDGFLTPIERFFVRNHAATPRIDAGTYRLRVEGDAVEQPLELTLADLRAMHSRSVIAFMECGGNWRGMAPEVFGKAAQGGQWRTGAVGCAEWTGVPLSAVLERAGVRSGAVDVNLVGLDEAAFERPTPIAKAMNPDTILAYAMNGALLPPDHGYPLRAVVPGWVGSNSIKWLGRIVVSTEKVWVHANTASYVLVGEDWPAEQYAPAEGAPVTEQTLKSALALPWPATLALGTHVLRGFAHGPHPIRSVAWSDDGGGAWHEARIVSPVLPHAWVRFEFDWDATPGDHTLMVRATDAEGQVQPMTVPFNEKGYLFNMVLPHPVRVA